MNQNSVVSGRVHCPADQAESQYNLRRAFPHYTQVRKEWLRAGAHFRSTQKPVADLAYGNQPLQTLDLFQASGANRPLLVFIHGGYWQGGDKADSSFIARPFVEAGINVALPNYSLAPDSPIEDMLLEMRQALSSLLARAGDYGFNPGHVSLMGHSAGGHLATMTASYAACGATELPLFRQVISVSGLHDLVAMLPSSLNQALGLDRPRAEALSPVLQPPPGNSSVYTLVGQQETAQFHAQSAALQQAWPQQVKGHFEVAGTDHYTILNVLADSTTTDSRRLVDILLS